MDPVAARDGVQGCESGKSVQDTHRTPEVRPPGASRSLLFPPTVGRPERDP